MFGLGACQLITLLVFSSRTGAQNEPRRNLTRLETTSENPTEIADQATNSSEKQYLVEYSDYMDVPKRHDNGRFDYYNFASGVSMKIDDRIVINKCCSRNFYFDVDRLHCVKLEHRFKHNFTRKIEKSGNGSNYIFFKNLPNCGNNSVLSVHIATNVQVDSTGVTVDGDGPFDEYCVDETPKYPNSTVILKCNDADSFCSVHPCFRKCCPIGESYVSSERNCRKTNYPFKPDFFNLTSLSLTDVSLTQFGMFLQDACGVKGKYLLEKELGETSYLGVNGNLYVPINEKSYSYNEFCVEYIDSGNNSAIESFLCFAKNNSNFENSPLQFFLLSLGFFISCMFLMLTFLVYLFSPKSQNLHGKTLMCYIASLFTAYLCLAVVQLKSKELSKNVCTNMGYSILFSFLAAFFWLNVMSFDIWKTFRSDRSIDRTKKDKCRLRFFKYSLYAWIFPSVITIVCGVVNQIPNFPYEAIRPAIGEENCWFSKKTKGIYVFFIAPITIIITCNIIFYVQTAWKIWKVKSDVNKMEKQKTKKFSANKNQFIINGKLFVVMGITWSLEIISFFAPHPIWYITDTANALNGVFIFAIFVLKRKVLQQVSQQLRVPLKIMRQMTNGSSDDLSTKKNFQDTNTEGKTCATATTPMPDESKA